MTSSRHALWAQVRSRERNRAATLRMQEERAVMRAQGWKWDRSLCLWVPDPLWRNEVVVNRYKIGAPGWSTEIHAATGGAALSRGWASIGRKLNLDTELKRAGYLSISIESLGPVKRVNGRWELVQKA